MNNVLIFGCNGFVGKYLASEFGHSGYRVFASGRLECDESLNRCVKSYITADLTDFEKVCDLIADVKPDMIINLAAVSSVAESWSMPQRTVEINLVGTLNILEAVRKLRLDPKILLVGSSEEYAISNNKMNEKFPIAANNPYGLSKVAQEHFAELYRKEYGLRIICTRTFNHTGYGQSEAFAIPSFVKQVARIHNSGKPGTIKVGNLDVRRDWGDVRDMAKAYRMILESESKEMIFNVGSGYIYRLSDILNYIISLSNQTINVEIDPTKLRPIDNPVIWCDNSKIRKEIGWEPQYTVYDAINEMFNKMTGN
ncbi:SDR family NAD(P)-dependent oxidoreductase [Kineothrix sp. MSJ-39]|uniref:SDR family NAD(P)-dependent oxidoreductase n=1 Tax=Kineothrix sp. MSJ-39 TaxID=2841533 RepID=UPI001C1001FD|nr:SDR family NAD(P)-dependent oxidoreductase [Kineothrix sp. MSJ-39]MBU5430220.1 SDR family NAD(P)-dependent oxidoreductase [Kineothrix sp. MSJ-39]